MATKKIAKKSASKPKVGYVDGFVIMIPKKNIDAYKKEAKIGEKLWMKYGALDYKECLIDDAKPEWVELKFPKMVNVKPTETIIFSYIGYKSRAHRDQVNKKVMQDPAMGDPDKKMPFEMNRMSYAGFEVLVG